MMTAEKREYPRVNLQISDGYFGSFKLKNEEVLQAPIVNISAGGLNMVAPQNAQSKIQEGDRLLLQSIAGGTNFKFLSDIKAEIRWIKPLDLPDYIAVGCKFADLGDSVREQLMGFVDSERMSRGQYD